MKDDKQNTNITVNQENDIIDFKAVLERKAEILQQVGKLQAFGLIKKYASVAEILAFKAIKDSGEYKGLPYIDAEGNRQFTTSLKDFCPAFLHRSYNAMNEDLHNIEFFGQAFIDSAQAMQLSYRTIRQLKKCSEDERTLIIDSEAFKAGDVEALKEQMEDIAEKHSKEKAELEQKAHEATQLASARKKIAETNASMFEEQMKKNDMLEQNQKAPSADWAKVVHEINLECTKIAAVAIEQMDKLLAMNERIISEEITPEHSQTAYEHMAMVQVHVVDQLFVVANTLSIETRERFDMFISDARPMYSEDEVLALEQQVKNRG